MAKKEKFCEILTGSVSVTYWVHRKFCLFYFKGFFYLSIFHQLSPYIFNFIFFSLTRYLLFIPHYSLKKGQKKFSCSSPLVLEIVGLFCFAKRNPKHLKEKTTAKFIKKHLSPSSETIIPNIRHLL